VKSLAVWRINAKNQRILISNRSQKETLFWLWGPVICGSQGRVECGKMSELKIRIETDEWTYEEYIEA
jgi:hypothetical protein